MAMTTQFLYEHISQQRYAVLATISANHTPQAACVGIAVTPDLRLVFDTVTDSRKYANLLADPHIAFVISVGEEKTIQYEGIAYPLTEPGNEELLEVYFSVFPDGRKRRDTWKNITWFCVEPRWIRHSDFSATPALIEEIRF